jgi:hypothetical protein
MHVEIRNAYNILVKKLKGKRPFGTPKCRWEDNIKMHLKEMVYVDSQDRVQQWAFVNITILCIHKRQKIH